MFSWDGNPLLPASAAASPPFLCPPPRLPACQPACRLLALADPVTPAAPPPPQAHPFSAYGVQQAAPVPVPAPRPRPNSLLVYMNSQPQQLPQTQSQAQAYDPNKKTFGDGVRSW